MQAYWKDYVKKKYIELLTVKYGIELDPVATSPGKNQLSTAVTDGWNAPGAGWRTCPAVSGSSTSSLAAIRGNYINDVRYSISGSYIARRASSLADRTPESSYDVVQLNYEVSELRIGPSYSYDNKPIEVCTNADDPLGCGVRSDTGWQAGTMVYGAYNPCDHLREIGAVLDCDGIDGSCETGLCVGSCQSNYATYMFQSTENDGSAMRVYTPVYEDWATYHSRELSSGSAVSENAAVITYSLVLDTSDNPDDPENPEDPETPDDYTPIKYLTLDTNQVVLTNEATINTGSKIVCEFTLDIDSTTNYSPRLVYPIITCPVGYQESGCDVDDLYLYSTPQSLQVAVGYVNADLYDSILSVEGPTSCGTGSTTQNTSRTVTGDHTVELDLQSVAGDSSVKLDSYKMALDHLNGSLAANATRPRVLAIGGYACGNEGVARYDCVGMRKIRSVRITGASTNGSVNFVTWQPVEDSSGREGLRNTKTGRIVYPITAMGYGNYYVADYIILNANKGIKLNAQVASTSVVTVTFKVPEENTLGEGSIDIPLLSLQGTVDGKLTTIDVYVSTFVNAAGTALMLMETCFFNDVTPPLGLIFGVTPIDLDSGWHTYAIDFKEGKILLDGEVIEEGIHDIVSGIEGSSLNWDRPSSDDYPILAGETRLYQYNERGPGYIAISKVEVRDAYRTELDYNEGLAAYLDAQYYLPALNRNYVACLTSSPADGYIGWLNPLYAEYSIPGYSIRDAGVYRLPGNS